MIHWRTPDVHRVRGDDLNVMDFGTYARIVTTNLQRSQDGFWRQLFRLHPYPAQAKIGTKILEMCVVRGENEIVVALCEQ